MTDKQINYEQNSVIIDGIDVSGCIHYKATGEYNTCGYYCEQNPNCYYKQSKRSEAQCEVMFVLHTDLEKRYKAKEQECEELKGKNNYSPEVFKQCPHYKNDNVCTYLGYETKCEGDCNYTAFQDFIAEIDQLKAENKTQKETIDGFLTILDKLGKNNIKLRETLAEIKDIVEQGVKIHDDIIVSKKILQIIDEVENGHTKED